MDFEALNAMAVIAERRISEAMSEGLFDNLPGRGQPLELEDLSHLAPEMRLAYIVLKNSGFMEDGVGLRIAAAPDKVPEGTPDRDWSRLERLRFKLARGTRRRPESDPLDDMDPAYLGKLLDRL
ncbi:MAG: DUF1992 domain-containing protein [Candidatus Adiutrix sp.]|jgi:hypothetical protein|nr:DUF1992 domain-containing protein [Candidatus Adiutrix sp.]